MNQKADASSKITNPERIARIVARMCDGHMQALIRTKDNLKIGIRANFAKFATNQTPCQIEFDKISSFGLAKLSKGMPIKIEVIGMPSKVMFVSSIIETTPEGINCSLPHSLLTIERRQNARYRMTASAMAYLSFSVWTPEDSDLTAPPFFDAYRSLANLVPVMDISTNGICLQSHFPSYINSLGRIELDPHAKLHLPMHAPIPIHAAVRWKRRIKNRIIEENHERYQLDFRVGIEFLELQDDQQLKIRNYLRLLSLADAI